MKKILLILITCFVFQGYSQNTTTFFEKADAFFKENVSQGRIAYSKIHANQKNLNELMTLAEGIKISVDDSNAYQAFWINSYNLSVIKGVINNFPLKSPLDKAGFFDKTKYNLGGKKVTLNDIENKLLRAQFKDARFHFVLVCGAIGFLQ